MWILQNLEFVPPSFIQLIYLQVGHQNVIKLKFVFNDILNYSRSDVLHNLELKDCQMFFITIQFS